MSINENYRLKPPDLCVGTPVYAEPFENFQWLLFEHFFDKLCNLYRKTFFLLMHFFCRILML